VVGIFAAARGREPIFSGEGGTRGRPGAKGPDLRLGQRHVVGGEAGKGDRVAEDGVASSPRWIVRLWWRGGVGMFISRVSGTHWWLAFRLGGDNILRLCWEPGTGRTRGWC
jgi:hypothetical protein